MHALKNSCINDSIFHLVFSIRPEIELNILAPTDFISMLTQSGTVLCLLKVSFEVAGIRMELASSLTDWSLSIMFNIMKL